MSTMLKEVITRMQRGEHGNITPTKNGQYCIEWTERTSPDPMEYISCKYMVRDAHSIAEINTHIRNSGTLKALMHGGKK